MYLKLMFVWRIDNIPFNIQQITTLIRLLLVELPYEKTCFFACVKTKVLISCAITSQLISAFAT